MSNTAYDDNTPIHYHGKQQGRCACGYAGLGASISDNAETVTCGMCKRAIESIKKRNEKAVKK